MYWCCSVCVSGVVVMCISLYWVWVLRVFEVSVWCSVWVYRVGCSGLLCLWVCVVLCKVVKKLLIWCSLVWFSFLVVWVMWVMVMFCRVWCLLIRLRFFRLLNCRGEWCSGFLLWCLVCSSLISLFLKFVVKLVCVCC